MQERNQESGCWDLQWIWGRWCPVGSQQQDGFTEDGRSSALVVVPNLLPLTDPPSFHFFARRLCFLVLRSSRVSVSDRRMPVTNPAAASQEQLKPIISSAPVSRLIYEFAFNTCPPELRRHHTRRGPDIHLCRPPSPHQRLPAARARRRQNAEQPATRTFLS